MKPQSLALAEYLNNGGTITRTLAWERFHIQNITARLSELTATGYSIIKTPYKELVDGKTIRLTAWKMRDRFTKGCRVKVIKDIGTLIALKGRIGLVENIDLKKALATVFIEGVGYRSLRFNVLERLPILPAGTRVTIQEAPYVILGYDAKAHSYFITSANPEHTIVAHVNLVTEANHVTTP